MRSSSIWGSAHDFSVKLAEADEIEGYPDFYDRATVVATVSESGEKVPCFVYHRPGAWRGPKRSVVRAFARPFCCATSE